MTTIAGTSPYPWPWDDSLDPSRLALLAVSAPGDGTTDTLGTAQAVADVVESLGGVVVDVATTLPASSASTSVAARPLGLGSREVLAHGVDGFFDSGLDPLLRALGRDQLLLCGRWLETSVHSTLRSANDRGYECLVVLDACTSFDPTLRASAQNQIEMSGGIFGAVGDSTAVIAALRSRPERTDS